MKNLSKTFRFTKAFYQTKKVLNIKTKALKLYNDDADSRGDLDELSDTAEFLASIRKNKKMELGDTLTLKTSRFAQKLLLSELELLKLVIVDKQFQFASQIDVDTPQPPEHSTLQVFFEHYTAVITAPNHNSLIKAIDSIREDLNLLKQTIALNDQQLDIVFFCLMIETLFLKIDFDGAIQKEVASCI